MEGWLRFQPGASINNMLASNRNSRAGLTYEPMRPVTQSFTAPGRGFLPLNLTTVGTGISISGSGTTRVNAFRISSGGAWDAKAYSSVSYTNPFTVQFNADAPASDTGAGYRMLSLNIDPTTNSSYTSLDYAMYPYRTSDLYMYHDGGGVGTIGGSWSSGYTWYYTYARDGFVRLYNGKALVWEIQRGGGLSLFLDIAFYSANSTYGGFSDIRIIQQEWNGAGYF